MGSSFSRKREKLSTAVATVTVVNAFQQEAAEGSARRTPGNSDVYDFVRKQKQEKGANWAEVGQETPGRGRRVLDEDGAREEDRASLYDYGNEVGFKLVSFIAI